MAYQKPDADERFRRLVDEFNFADGIVKEYDKRRELLRKKIRNIVRRRGRGVYNGHESSISAFDVERSIIDQQKVLQEVGPDRFPKMFRKSKFIQVEAGPLRSPSELLPELGPPKQEIQE